MAITIYPFPKVNLKNFRGDPIFCKPLAQKPFLCYISAMSTVAEIKEAIDQLSPQERCELESLLRPRVDDDWDRQMAADAEAGRQTGSAHTGI
jgi:hypothetical protein